MFWIVSLLKLNQSEVSLKVCLLPAANNFLLAYGARKNRFLDNGNETLNIKKLSLTLGGKCPNTDQKKLRICSLFTQCHINKTGFDQVK